MANDLLASLLDEIEELFRPLENAARDPEFVFALLRRLGWEIDDLAPAAATLSSSLQSIIGAIDQVRSVIAGGSPDFDAIARTLKETSKIPVAVDALKGQLATTLPVVAADLAVLPAELLEQLFIDWLRERSPLAFAVSAALGLIETQTVAERSDATNRVLRRPVTLARLRVERLSQWVTDPVGQAGTRFGVAGLATEVDARAYAMRVFPMIGHLMLALGAEPIMGRGPGLRRLSDEDELALAHMLSLHWRPPFDDAAAANVGVNIAALSAAENGPGIVLMPFGALTLNFAAGGWTGQVKLANSVDALFLKPSGAEFLGGTPAEFVGTLQITRPGTNNRLGSANGLRLDLGDLSIDAQFHITPTTREFGGVLEISKGALVVSGGDSDGFLQKVLPKGGLRTDFDLAIGLSNTRGFYFRGSAALEATLQIHKDLLGVLKVESIYLALVANGAKEKESKIQAVTATTVKVQLGPVSAEVERFGLQATLSFPEKGGNLGVTNLDLGFKPPSGVSLTIKAPVVTGGGYLYFDVEKEQYAGVLQLEIAEKISLSAVGLITTRMPDGKPGFSLLVIISARFDPGIQLGYGFTLNGLGGLLGVNRTVTVEVLRDGLRRGALGSILFPQNIVQNATQIVSNLSTIFPPAADRFLFGPMAILGWGGSPPLVSLELGIILELPEPVRLMILGRLRVTLPNTAGDGQPQTPIIKLQLDALGLIDFGSGDISLDAVLYDSIIGPFAVTGQMALRANFGTQPKFLLSVGGFHPAFQAPAGFPSVERVSFTLAKKDGDVEVRLQMSAYFALTSNTVQLGSRLDLYVHLGIFEVIGLLAFDALIQFQPFGLIASFEAMVVVKASGVVLLGIRLQVNLTGPSPWHAWGKAELTILFIRVTAEFSIQVGREEPPRFPRPIPVQDLLLKELQNPTNWSSQLPAGESPLVTFRSEPVSSLDSTGTPPPKKVLVHPLAELQVSQRLVPLEVPITRFGNTTPEGPTTFTLTTTASHEPVTDWFARAQFYDMSDAEKLSAKSFEPMQSGIRFKVPPGYECGTPVRKEMSGATHPSRGKTVPTGAPLSEPQSIATPPPVDLLRRAAAWSATGSAAIRSTGPAKYRDPLRLHQGLTLKPATYRVVGNQRGAVRPNVGPLGIERSLSFSAAHVLTGQAHKQSPTARWWVVPDLGPEGS